MVRSATRSRKTFGGEINSTVTALFFIFPLVCLILVGFAEAAVVGASSQLLEPDARSQGMGSAYTAIAEGPYASYWNPAALGLQEGLWGGWGTAQLIPDLADDKWLRSKHLSFSWSGLGIGFNRNYFDYGTSYITGDNPDEPIEYDSYEYSQTFGFGLNLLDVIRKSENFDLAIGVNYKQFKIDVAPPVILDFSTVVTASDIDIGFLVSGTKRFPNMDIIGVSWGETSNDHTTSISIRGGLVYKNTRRSPLRYAEIDQEHSDPLGYFRHSGIALEATLQRIPPFPHVVRLIYSQDWEDMLEPEIGPDIGHKGFEIDFLGVLAFRRGYIDDPDGDITDSTSGWGLGFDIEIDNRYIDRISARYDSADVPQASDLARAKKGSWAFRLIASPDWF
jgi:hypothetical protein